MASIVLVIFFFLLVTGLPLAFVLILSSIGYLCLIGDEASWMIVPMRLLRGTNSFLYICMPFFILAGNIMTKGGITTRLVNCAQALVGHIRGGLAMVDVLVSMFFGGISGSAVAGTSAVGTLMIPAMKKAGYDAGFAAGLTSVASTCAPIIPPSLAFVLYGASTRVSIGDLFIAGIIPGILMGAAMMTVVAVISRKRKYPKHERKPFKECLKAIFDALPSLMLPVLVIVGIISGWFTPTEAAAFAVVFALTLSVIYRNITWKELWEAIVDSAIDSAAIMLIVGGCALFGWVIANERITLMVANSLLDLNVPIWAKLIVINLGLLVLGMFLDSAPAILLVAPVLAPALAEMGLDPVHAGVMVCLNLVIGLSTPPIGVCLFAASNIGKVPLGETVRNAIPFVLATLFVLMLVTYLPILTMFLIDVLGF